MATTKTSTCDRPSAVSLICDDLEHAQRGRRRHFVPALLLLLAGMAGMAFVVGLRPDLLDQPTWQLSFQVVLWVLCLIVLPGIGVGIFFPSRPVRIGLGLTAVLMTLAATFGWPLELHGGSLALGGCAAMVTVYAALVLGLGLFSGAFSQRRAISSAYWIAAGITLTALNAVTWHCPMVGAAHVLSNHFGTAALLLVVVSALGLGIHRRSRR